MVQRGLHTSNAKGMGSTLGWGTKIPKTIQCSKKKKILIQKKLKINTQTNHAFSAHRMSPL